MKKERLVIVGAIAFLLAFSIFSSQAIALGEYEEQPDQVLVIDWIKRIFGQSLAPSGTVEYYMFEVKSSECFTAASYPITVKCDCDNINEYCSNGRYYCKVAAGAGTGDCSYASSYDQIAGIRPGESYAIAYFHTMACGQCWKVLYYGYSEPPDTTTTVPTTTTTTTIAPLCTPEYLDDYRCSADWKQRLYRRGDCSTVWNNYEYCDYGCFNGECSLPPTTTTTIPITTTTTECIPHYEKICYGGNVWWFDSCKDREEIAEYCLDDEECIEGGCIPTSVTTTVPTTTTTTIPEEKEGLPYNLILYAIIAIIVILVVAFLMLRKRGG